MVQATRLTGPRAAPAGAPVEVAALQKRYLTGGMVIHAVDGIDLRIAAGAVVAVTGPSGSGKSTLLHLIGAMERPDEGRIFVDGFEVTALSRREQDEYRRRIGFVFQRFHLLPALSAIDNVAAPLLPYRTAVDKHERARELLAAVGLAGREGSLPSELSSGQQQRVAIARALVNDPILLLADEPTGNLDSNTGREVMDLLLELCSARGMTLIVATHDAAIASRCERLVRLLDGRVIEELDVPRHDRNELLERITRLDAGV